MAAVISSRLPETGKDSGKSIFKETGGVSDKVRLLQMKHQLSVQAAVLAAARTQDQSFSGTGSSTASPLPWSCQATRLP